MAPGEFIDSLDYLPPFFMNDAPDIAASKSESAGAANVNLRGLGAQRTLVLLDGRRMVPSKRLGAVDIHLSPEAMVERVEIVTGGASAVYCTDAVAGMVNSISKDHFEGFDIHTQVGETARDDGESRGGSVAYGTNIGERGHLMVSGECFDAHKIETLEGRDWFQSWGLIQNPGAGARDLVRPDVVSYTYTAGGSINSTLAGVGRRGSRSDGDPPLRVPARRPVQPSCPGISSAPPRQRARASHAGRHYGTHQISNGGSGWDAVVDRGGSLVPDTERGSVFAHYDFDLSDTTTLYGQFVAGNNEVNSVGTLPLGIAGWAGTVYSGNPFLPANIQQLMTANNIPSFLLERYHTTADLAHDRFITDNDTRSLTFGGDAELRTACSKAGRSAATRSSARTTTRSRRSTSSARTVCPKRWMRCGIRRRDEIVCRAALFDPANYGNCVPINLLGVGRASQAAIDYVLTGDQYILAETDQKVVEFSMEGEIGDGWGAGAISLAFGGGWREESIDQRSVLTTSSRARCR